MTLIEWQQYLEDDSHWADENRNGEWTLQKLILPDSHPVKDEGWRRLLMGDPGKRELFKWDGRNPYFLLDNAQHNSRSVVSMAWYLEQKEKRRKHE